MEDSSTNICDYLVNSASFVNFSGVDLRGKDLSCLDGITAEQLREAIIDQTTMMPPGLEHLVREVPPFGFSN